MYLHMRDFFRVALFQCFGELTLPLIRHPADAAAEQDDTSIAADQFSALHLRKSRGRLRRERSCYHPTAPRGSAKSAGSSWMLGGFSSSTNSKVQMVFGQELQDLAQRVAAVAARSSFQAAAPL